MRFNACGFAGGTAGLRPANLTRAPFENTESSRSCSPPLWRCVCPALSEASATERPTSNCPLPLARGGVKGHCGATSLRRQAVRSNYGSAPQGLRSSVCRVPHPFLSQELTGRGFVSSGFGRLSGAASLRAAQPTGASFDVAQFGVVLLPGRLCRLGGGGSVRRSSRPSAVRIRSRRPAAPVADRRTEPPPTAASRPRGTARRSAQPQGARARVTLRTGGFRVAKTRRFTHPRGALSAAETLPCESPRRERAIGLRSVQGE
jgi:hypothetical protein